MFKRLIDALTLNYQVMAKSRGMMDAAEREIISGSGRVLIKYAPKTMVPDGFQMTDEDRTDLKECEMIQDHVQQMAEWIEQLRINEIM